MAILFRFPSLLCVCFFKLNKNAQMLLEMSNTPKLGSTIYSNHNFTHFAKSPLPSALWHFDYVSFVVAQTNGLKTIPNSDL